MPTRRAILYRCEHNLNIEYTSRKVLTWTTYGNYARVVDVSEIERESEGAASAYKRRDFWRETYTPLWLLIGRIITIVRDSDSK